MEKRLTDPHTGAQKGQKPQRFSLIPWQSVATISEVYHYGTKKYSEHNWRGGYRWSWSYDALQRHLTAWWEGEDRDKESGLQHLAHAGFHILSLLYYAITKKGTDDRYVEPESDPDSAGHMQGMGSEVCNETPLVRTSWLEYGQKRFEGVETGENKTTSDWAPVDYTSPRIRDLRTQGLRG